MAKKLPPEIPVRTKAIMFYLTEADAEWYNEIAETYGFKSRSQLFTAIAESLRCSEFSAIGASRMALRIQKHGYKHNPNLRQGGFDFHTLRARPYPVLGEEELTDDDIDAIIEELKTQKKGIKK